MHKNAFLFFKFRKTKRSLFSTWGINYTLKYEMEKFCLHFVSWNNFRYFLIKISKIIFLDKEEYYLRKELQVGAGEIAQL